MSNTKTKFMTFEMPIWNLVCVDPIVEQPYEDLTLDSARLDGPKGEESVVVQMSAEVPKETEQ